MIYGYHRTSTTEQHIDRGIKEITEYCYKNHLKLESIETDQQTGKNFNRPNYLNLKNKMLRSGDTLLITEVDRLGRNKQDTLKELKSLQNKGIRVMILELPTTCMDLSKLGDEMAKMMLETINNMMIELYASMAHAEMIKKEKRQKEGIEAKKARGEWEEYGRPKAMDIDLFAAEYQRVLDGSIKPFELMRELGLSKPTFYRYKKQLESMDN